MIRRAIIKLHYACNNNCLFCHACSNKNIPASHESIIKKIEIAKDAGIDQVLLSGGEPTIYPQLKEVLRELRKNALAWGLVTNGRMLAYRNFARYILAMGTDYFYISLHSHTRDIHDAITGVQGAWEQVFAGIETIAELAGTVDFTINCVVTTKNIEHLNEMTGLVQRVWNGRDDVKLKFSYPEPKGRVTGNIQSIVPAMEYAGEKISEAMSIAENAGINSYYDGLPYCLINSRFRERVNDLSSNHIYLMSEVDEEIFFETDNGVREKSGECGNCLYNARCPGYYAGYKPKKLTIPK
ncbi:MAG: radical SAM protein [bacterium]|nr:radical SAM protein [bacterium]